MADDIRYYEEARFGIRTTVLTVLACLGLLLIPVAAIAQQAVSEITVINGGSYSIACPGDFEKIDVDLNRNAGGDYIFVCYKKGLGAPVTGLWVTADGTAPVPAGKGFVQIPVDLNRGAGGDTIYLWYTKDPNCSVLSAITAVYGNSSSIACPAGFAKINVDLNRGAGGDTDYIYICEQMQ